MKIGQLVRFLKSTEDTTHTMLGVVKAINPLKDDKHTEIFWLDASIPSVCLNSDIEVTNFKDAGVKAFIDELSRTQRDILMRVVS